MTTVIVTLIAIVCALPVLVRAFCILVKAMPRGQPRWRHFGFTASAASVGTGAIAAVLVAAGVQIELTARFASLGLLCGLAGLIVFDRRQRRIGG